MKRGVALLLEERDIDEIFITYSLEMLAAKAAGLSRDEMLRKLPRKVLEDLRQNSTTDY